MSVPVQLELLKRRGRVPNVLPKPKEHQIQMAVIQLLHLQARPEIEYWHTPNGAMLVDAKRQGAKLKAMGTRPGVADLQFIFPVPTPNLFLELKARNGKLDEDQEHFRDRVRALGHAYEMADSFPEAERILRQYKVLREATP